MENPGRKTIATPMNLLDIDSNMIVAPSMAALRPQTPDYQATSVNVASPALSVLSDWAETLEKALENDNQPGNFQAKAGYVSVPPHLRKHLGEDNGMPEKKHSGLDPKAASFPWACEKSLGDEAMATAAEAIVNEEVRLEDEIVAWQLASSMADNDDAKWVSMVGKTNPCAHTKTHIQAHELQQGLLDHSQAQKSAKYNPAYEHRVKVLMIRALEHELDLGEVATESQLMEMTDENLDSYHGEIRSAHRNWWEAEQLARRKA